MSTCNTRLRCAQEGQTVIVYGGRESLSIVTLAAGQQFSNKHGHFKHEQFIGAPFGSKIYALKAMRSGAEPGWVVLLEITPSLYPLACSHRTEILYHADIGYVVHRLGIRPGSVVFEAGTGSGALSVAFAFALQPHGHLYTFEYHQLRANAARDDFVRFGLKDVVTVLCRDVMKEGFVVSSEIRGDVVFLDLPAPWLVVSAARAVLHPHGRFASFSPCIEQVVKTCEALHTHHFADIVTVEVLLRNFEVLRLVGSQSEENFFQKRHTTTDQCEPSTTTQKSRKRSRIHNENIKKQEVNVEVESEEENDDERNEAIKSSLHSSSEHYKLLTRPCSEMRGHTGYLTFAHNTNTQ